MSLGGYCNASICSALTRFLCNSGSTLPLGQKVGQGACKKWPSSAGLTRGFHFLYIEDSLGVKRGYNPQLFLVFNETRVRKDKSMRSSNPLR